jgi:hypothetical protein
MNCIFGIFDVLGFTTFCENCDPPSAGRVLKVMDDFESETPETLLRALDVRGNIPQDKKELVKNRLRWLTFSDTIFAAMPVDLQSHPDRLEFDLFFFMVLVAYMNRKMFEVGLPVRGAIHMGDVIVSKRCFAGRPIMEAYNLGKKCQVSATVISDEAYGLLLKIFSESTRFRSLFSNSIVECDVPMGTTQLPSSLCVNNSEKMKTLCWFYLEIGSMEQFAVPSDWGGFVRGKFAAHGKRLSGEREKMKAVNTEKLFRDWQAASRRHYHELTMVASGAARH